MYNTKLLAVVVSLAAPMLLSAGAMAATPNHYTGTSVTNPQGATAPSQRNPLLTDSGAVRIGKMVGTDIYNGQDQKLGTVDGVLIDKTGQVEVIISHDSKLVSVPWSKFQFGNADQNSDNRVLMPGATKDQFNSMQAF